MRSSRGAASVVAGACVAAAAGCGVVTSPEQVIPSGHVAEPIIIAPAQDHDTLEEAYATIAAHELDQAVRPDLLDPRRDRFTSHELSDGLVEHFTPEVRTAWRGLVRAAKGSDARAKEAVRVLRYFDLEAPGLSLPADGDPVVRQRIVSGTVRAQPPPRPSRITEPSWLSSEVKGSSVIVDLEHLVTLGLRPDGRPVHLDLRRSVEYELVPGPGGAPGSGKPRWLIADFEGEYTFKD